MQPTDDIPDGDGLYVRRVVSDDKPMAGVQIIDAKHGTRIEIMILPDGDDGWLYTMLNEKFAFWLAKGIKEHL